MYYCFYLYSVCIVLLGEVSNINSVNIDSISQSDEYIDIHGSLFESVLVYKGSFVYKWRGKAYIVLREGIRNIFKSKYDEDICFFIRIKKEDIKEVYLKSIFRKKLVWRIE